MNIPNVSVFDFVICPHCRSIEIYGEDLLPFELVDTTSCSCQNCEQIFYCYVQRVAGSIQGTILVKTAKNFFVPEDLTSHQILTFHDIFGKG